MTSRLAMERRNDMGTLIRMAGLRDLRRDDGVSDVSADVLGDGMTHEAKLNLLRNELAYYHSKEREARRQAESVLRDLLEIRRTAPSVDMMVESALRRA